MSYHFIKKAKTSTKWFFFSLGLICMVPRVTTAKAVENSVKSGQYFWQISRSGLNPSFSYILGSRHDMCLDDHSLPIEIKRALKSTRVGILEAHTGTFKEQMTLRFIHKMSYLPTGITLSDFLGEEKVREIFDFFRFFVATYDTEERDLEKILKLVMTIDVRNYEQFNRLHPMILNLYLSGVGGIYEIINLAESQKPEVENKTPDEIIQNFIDTAYESLELQNDEERFFDALAEEESFSPDSIMLFKRNRQVCLSHNPFTMDLFIEKSLFCDKKPIYPLEASEDVTTAFLSAFTDLETQADDLYNSFNEIKAIGKIDFRFFSWYPQTDLFTYLQWPFEDFKDIVIYNFETMFEQEIEALHTTSSEDHFPEEDFEAMVDFLKERGCAISVEINSLIDTYINTLQQKVDFSVKVSISGESIDEDIMKTYSGFNTELKQLEKDIFSACFPSYQYASRELEDDREKGELQMLKTIAILTTSRDQKMMRSMLPFLDKGGVFAVMGFAHLNGVIKHLRAAGYSVNPVHLSSPIVEAEGCSDGALGFYEFDPENIETPEERLISPPL